MAVETQAKNRFRRCFVIGTPGPATNALVAMLVARNIETTTAGMLKSGASITQEILRLIAAADFVAVLLDDRGSQYAYYELGVARALGKPAFVVLTEGPFGMDISGVYVRAIESLARIGDVAGDLDQFLDHAKRPAPIVEPNSETQGVGLAWARQDLARLRSGVVKGREAVFEDLVGRIFESAGAQVLPNDNETREVDFVVWLNEIAFETGGPVLIECKLFQGGSGSVIMNSQAFVKRLERTLATTNSDLALLIYDHDRPNTPPSLYETPRVLSFAVEEVITRLEGGTLEREILKRRERAAFMRKPS